MRDVQVEMAYFDALGPRLRAVIANAPEQLDASKVVISLRMTPRQLRVLDGQIAAELAQLIAAEDSKK